MASVIVAGRQLYWKIGKAEFFVHADLRPNTGVARVVRGIVFPSIVAKFAGSRNGMEDPEALTGLHVKSAHIALHILLAFGRAAIQMSGADDYGVTSNQGCGVKSDFAIYQIYLLVVVELQIHYARIAEGRSGGAGPSIQ